MKRIALASIAVLLASCAAPAKLQIDPDVAKQRAREIIARANLPSDSVITDGSEKTYLRIAETGPYTFAHATEADANFTIEFTAREEKMTIVSFHYSGGGPVNKIDLYISLDGERWEYTSSCPIGATFETWSHPVQFLAVAHPHVGREGLCQ